MDDPARIQLEHDLQGRKDSIAETWYLAIAQTSFAPFPSAELRRRLADLTGQAIALLFTEPFATDQAQQIGVALAGLHYTQPEALGRTQGVLARELLSGLPVEQVLELRPQLVALLEGVAIGLARQSTRIQLLEQESIRSALVSELRATERELREARDHLEELVERRTEELRESEERWHTLVSSAPDPVITIDAEGRVQFVNYLHPDSGLTLENLLGRNVLDMVLPEHRELTAAAIRHVFATGASAVYEAALRRPNGTVVWYASHMGPLRHDGRVVAALVIARDITERKRIEEMKDNLLRDVSHELRTPLARTQISLELLLETIERNPADREDAVKYGRMALDNVRRLAQTVEVILDLSRLEAGVGAFQRERIRLADLIAAAIGDMEPLASDKGLVLVAAVAEDLPPVMGDREKLSRVLRNLIDNAIKFSSSGKIVVSADGNQDEVEVSVRDEGCGILPDNLERVFDRFYRESTENPGVGVGLPMCKTIVEAHSGRIWAESAGRGKGATLRFRLPIEDKPGQ